MVKVQIFHFNPFGVNTLVVWDSNTKDAIVVDPGMCSSKENAALDDFIAENGLVVVHLINTHMHVDHIMGDAHVKAKYGVKVEAGAEDATLGQNAAMQARMFGVDYAGGAVAIDRVLKEGDVVAFGDSRLKVLHVPGHSPGSIALYSADDGFVIVGDVLFKSSVGRTDLPGGNHETLIDSITSKLLPLPDDTVVIPGHGPVTTIGDEKLHNPYI